MADAVIDSAKINFINAAKITTGILQSNQTTVVNNLTVPTWSLDLNGNAVFNNGTFRGTVVGSIFKTSAASNDGIIIDPNAPPFGANPAGDTYAEIRLYDDYTRASRIRVVNETTGTNPGSTFQLTAPGALGNAINPGDVAGATLMLDNRGQALLYTDTGIASVYGKDVRISAIPGTTSPSNIQIASAGDMVLTAVNNKSCSVYAFDMYVIPPNINGVGRGYVRFMGGDVPETTGRIALINTAGYGVVLKAYYNPSTGNPLRFEVRNANDTSWERMGATAFDVLSDVNTKDEIRIILSGEKQSMLSELMETDLYSYKRIRDDDLYRPTEIGMIAQKAPALITSGPSGTMTVDLYQAQAMHLAAFQEFVKETRNAIKELKGEKNE